MSPSAWDMSYTADIVTHTNDGHKRGASRQRRRTSSGTSSGRSQNAPRHRQPMPPGTGVEASRKQAVSIPDSADTRVGGKAPSSAVQWITRTVYQQSQVRRASYSI